MVEMIVVISILAVLAIIVITGIARMIDRAKCVVDAGKLRAIHGAVASRALENNDIAYTRDEIGGGAGYRQWDDPLSLCQVLSDYLPGEDAWLSPKPTKSQRRFKNSYAWSVNTQIAFTDTATPTDNNPLPGKFSRIPKPILLAFNSYCYTLPAGFNRYQSSALSPAPRNYWYRPWNGGKSINRVYTDGHVESFDQP
jgi:type II secretory pathway pseudopilin PulG